MTHPQRLVLPAPAKLNLFLHITGRRADGYHNLQTIFQILDYADILTLQQRQDTQITLQCSDATLADSNNLVVRAAQALQAHAMQMQLPAQNVADCQLGVDISLEKHIPAGAGLGGGSSDAATALLGLNQLWQLGLGTAELADIGKRLGADVPVFIHGHTAWAEGTGELLTPVDVPDAWFLVLTPPCHVPTARIFSHQELTRDSSPIKIRAFLAGQTQNDCEALVRKLYPQVGHVLDWLSGYSQARMTGTGASVFAKFANKQEAESVLLLATSSTDAGMANVKGFVARGVNRSAVLDQLHQSQQA